MIGLKLLREDGTSLREIDRVHYPPNEEIIVGGNGAYVAISDGLTCGGKGPLLVALECEEEVDVQFLPCGVKCFRRVRRIGNGIPSQPVLDEYHRIRDKAWKEYNRVCDEVEKEYEQVYAKAKKEYNRICNEEYNRVYNEALKEYYRIRDEAEKEYNRIRDEALKEYYRVHDEAEKEYNRIRAEARGEYNRICNEALKEYNRIRDEAWNKMIERVIAKTNKDGAKTDG